MSRWVVTYACTPIRCTVPLGRAMPIGEQVVLGREGGVAVGADPEDRGVSRTAALLTATDDGWDLDVRNHNGIVVHPWGQQPAPARRHEVLTWPRVGLWVRGTEPAAQHWVLLETDSIHLPATGPLRPDGPGTRTARSRAADPLTPAQVEALETVFGQHLTWPPVAAPVALEHKQAASRLGLSEAGVKDRLLNAQRRAEQLGLQAGMGTTDPAYLYFLVRAGLLEPPERIAHRRVSAPSGVEAAAEQSRSTALRTV